MRKGILLETTVQLKRVAGFPSDREEISKELKGRVVRTISFVFREFINTIITDIEYVYLVTQQITDDVDARIPLGNLCQFLASGKGNYSPRSARRQYLVIASILDNFAHTTVSRQRLLTHLERISEQWRRDFFELSYVTKFQEIKPVITPVDNPDEIDKLKHSVPFPPKLPFPAGASGFLNKNKDSVRQVEAAITQLGVNPKIKRKGAPLVKVLNRLKDKKSGEYDFLSKLSSKTQGNWWLGDLLIALMTPTHLSIYTTDQLYDCICPVLGKTTHLGFLSGNAAN